MREGEGVAHWNQVGGALGSLDAGESRDFERVALGILGQCGDYGCGKFDKGGCGGGAPGGLLGADVDHAGLAGWVEVGEGGGGAGGGGWGGGGPWRPGRVGWRGEGGGEWVLASGSLRVSGPARD